MQPSSLVFLILIGIWAAYLLQHWVRRREHLATARSVDRFSDAMRVLERRSPLPELDLAVPRPRSYAVMAARPSHPEVVVTRARTVRPEAPTAPERAAATDSPVRPTRVFHVLAGVSARRVRALSLVASLLLAAVITPLAASSVLPWWSAPVVIGALIADVTCLRHAAVSQRAADRAEARGRWSEPGPARADASDARDARDTDYFEAESVSRVESETQSAYDAEAAYDGQPPVARETAPSSESLVEVDPSAWAPVPVPPPTYTLKAKAADPVPLPAPVPEQPVVAAPVYELGESECWSLDGMVYDCDLDELVERRSGTGA